MLLRITRTTPTLIVAMAFAATLVTVVATEASNAVRTHGSGAHGPADPADWIAAIDEHEPEVIVVANRLMRGNLDLEQLAEALGARVSVFTTSAGMSAWQFLVVKNVIEQTEHVPEAVVLVTRDDYLTRPRKGVTQDFVLQLNALHGRHNRGAQHGRREGSMFIPYVVEPELETLAYGTGDLPTPTAPVEHSFLPYMLEIAGERGFRLAVVRFKRYQQAVAQAAEGDPTDLLEHIDPEIIERFHSTPTTRHTRALADYLDREGTAFIDLMDHPDITPEHFTQHSDRLTGDGQTLYTQLIADGLRPLLDASPPAVLTHRPTLPVTAAFAPSLEPGPRRDPVVPEPDADLAQGLLAHWRLDGDAGTIVTDSGPHAIHGKMRGQMSYEDNAVTGAVGGALAFDGIDQTIEFRSEHLKRLPQTSASFWINWSGPNTGATFQTLVGDYHFYRGLFIYCSNQGAITFASYHEAEDRRSPRRHNLNWRHQLEPGEWTHLVAVFDGEQKITYVNGEQANRTEHSGEIVGAGGLFLGWSVNVYYFHGQMDDVRLYDRALGEDEIRQLYELGK